MADRTTIRYAKLTEAVKQSLLEMQSLSDVETDTILILTLVLPPRHLPPVVLPALDCRVLLNQKGVGQREAVYLTLDLLLQSFIPQTPALGLRPNYTGSSPSYLSNWSVPRPCCPLPNGACLCTEGQIQSRPSLNIFE